MCVVSTPTAGPLGSDRTRAEGLAFRVEECLSPEKQPMLASWTCWLQGAVSQGGGAGDWLYRANAPLDWEQSGVPRA